MTEQETPSDHTTAALRKAEEKYRSLFENAPEGIIRTTAEGRVLSANPALAHIFGYTSPAEIMAAVTDIGDQFDISPEERQEHLRLIQ